MTGSTAVVDGSGLPTAVTAFLNQQANSATAASTQVLSLRHCSVRRAAIELLPQVVAQFSALVAQMQQLNTFLDNSIRLLATEKGVMFNKMLYSY